MANTMLYTRNMVTILDLMAIFVDSIDTLRYSCISAVVHL